MTKNLTREIDNFYENRIKLDELLNNTKKVIGDFKTLHVFDDEKFIDEFLPPELLTKLNDTLNSHPALVILGQDNKSKALFINDLLSCNALPVTNEGNWRWVKLQYNKTPSINLSLGLKPDFIDDVKNNFRAWIDFTVNTLKAIGKYEKLDWNLIKSPSLINQEDLTVMKFDDPTSPVTVEAKLNNALLRDITVYVAPQKSIDTLKTNHFRIIPLFVYILGEDFLNTESIEELRNLKESYPRSRVLFLTRISAKDNPPESNKLDELRASCPHSVKTEHLSSLSKKIEEVQHLKHELLTKIWDEQLHGLGYTQAEITNLDDQPEVLTNFIISNVKDILLDCSRRLNEVHSSGLRKIILSAFDMSREIDITPKRLDYVRKMESELYKKLIDEMYDEQKMLNGLIDKIIEEMKASANCRDMFNNNNNKQEGGQDIEELALNLLTRKVTEALVASTECLQEMFTGTLKRCLLKLEEGNYADNSTLLASSALNKILSVAYNVKLQDISSSMFIKSLQCPSLSTSPRSNFDTSWRETMFYDVLHSISPSKLSHIISTRFREQVQSSHEEFQTALKSLECHLFNKLKQTEQRKFAIRKNHAPKLARLELESNSLCDLIQHGSPVLRNEIGRGAFGIVFACNWGSMSTEFAVKSLVPNEEGHWNDLAMEFYYTRSIPDHERILKLRGSVIEKVHGFSKILLITDRMAMDLYRGLRQGLSFLQRIQIAIDVSEGIRYLHSLGLIHRDIKLKNVLLDIERRAKLSDFGFCVTQAMLSGSIVGSPIHMAPELVVGNYDSSVDVYAFGILFWYICAGTVNLPLAFQDFDNKEELWIKVRKGIRPERLSSFREECWRLMTQCWDSDPSKRPLLGAIMPVLESVRQSILNETKNLSDDNNATQKSVPEQHHYRNKMVQTAPVDSVLSIIRNCKRHTSSM